MRFPAILSPVTAPLRLLLLPGLDGTGALFEPRRRRARSRPS
ncbi:hypothetical protein WME95_30610 [Sorangium sp. So ce327]